MGREFELKYGATEDILEAIRTEFGDFSPISMETTYFDTPTGDLSARRTTLRLRKENGTAVCTLKTPGDALGRGEWEVLCDDIQKAIPLLLEADCPGEWSLLTKADLKPVCGARFTRLTRDILLPDGRAELALDQGVLTGGGRVTPLCEIEVECKEGPEAVTEAFARELAVRYNLVPEAKSKFRRALDLTRGEENG